MRSSALLLLLTACGGDSFFSIPEGGLPTDDSGSESSTDADSGMNPGDGGGLDAREAGEDSSTDDTGIDAKADGPCPTGVAACDDTIASFCSRLKTCCAGQCMYAWANNGGSQCAMQFNANVCQGKTTCEDVCQSDIQAASCSTIKSAPSPAYVGSCMGIW